MLGWTREIEELKPLIQALNLTPIGDWGKNLSGTFAGRPGQVVAHYLKQGKHGARKWRLVSFSFSCPQLKHLSFEILPQVSSLDSKTMRAGFHELQTGERAFDEALLLKALDPAFLRHIVADRKTKEVLLSFATAFGASFRLRNGTFRIEVSAEPLKNSGHLYTQLKKELELLVTLLSGWERSGSQFAAGPRDLPFVALGLGVEIFSLFAITFCIYNFPPLSYIIVVPCGILLGLIGGMLLLLFLRRRYANSSGMHRTLLLSTLLGTVGLIPLGMAAIMGTNALIDTSPVVTQFAQFDRVVARKKKKSGVRRFYVFKTWHTPPQEIETQFKDQPTLTQQHWLEVKTRAGALGIEWMPEAYRLVVR